MEYLHGVPLQTLEGKKILSVKHGATKSLMPKINPYNAYMIVTEDKTYVLWNAYGETNLSEVKS